MDRHRAKELFQQGAPTWPEGFMEKDQAELDAEALLPCECNSRTNELGQTYHGSVSCYVFKRPTVAAELRKRDEEITRLTTDRNGYGDMCQELESQLAYLTRWKQEMLAVESQWEPQAVAIELDLKLGKSIRAGILPAVVSLKSQLAAAKQEIERLKMALVDREKNNARVVCVKCGGDFTNYDEPCHDCYNKLRAELAALKEQNQTLWASLTAEKRFELNMAEAKGTKDAG